MPGMAVNVSKQVEAAVAHVFHFVATCMAECRKNSNLAEN